MAPTTRSATTAKLRRLAAIPRSTCDWLGEIFSSKDLGPLVVECLADLEDIVSYAQTCRALRDITNNIWKKVFFLAEEFDNDLKMLLNAACLEGNVRLYEFCVRNGAEISQESAEAAIAGGQIDMLDRIHFSEHSSYSLDRWDMAYAAHRGQLRVLKWMKDTLTLQWDEYALASAASEGHADCLAFILDKGLIFKGGETFAGSSDSFVDLDPFVWPLKCTGCLESAAEGGHLDCVQLIKEKCAPAELSIRAANMAAGNGHLHVLKWMWPQMNAWSANIGMYAVEGDHIECFQFVWEKLSDTWEVAIPWQLMFDATILLGKPKCMRFLLGTGRFVILDHTRHQLLTRPATTGTGAECLRVCAEHPNQIAFTAADLTTAAFGVGFDIVTVLVEELKVPWEEKVLEKLVIGEDGSPDMFVHCLALGAPAPSDLVLTLCLRGEYSLLKHVLEKRNPVFEDITIQACAKKHEPECARALIAHYDNKKEMKKFLLEVFSHPCMAECRPKRQAFMNHVFGPF